MLEPAIQSRVERLLGQRLVAVRPVTGGYTTMTRVIVTGADGRSAFVKTTAIPFMAAWVRAESAVYAALDAEPFLPRCLAFDEDGTAPILMLEDLSHCHWPPPWTPAQIAAVLAALERLRACAPRAPEQVGSLETIREELCRWGKVADNPESFLSVGLCSAAWLEAALPTLLAAEQAIVLAGDDLVHLDIRSDNLCFRPDGSAVLVDWNWAMIGNGQVDIAAWLPSLHAEGGPLPETILPDAGPLAAAFAGFWAASAGDPPPPTAPQVRVIQRRQVEVALPWAARALGLPRPDGTLTAGGM